MKLVAFGFLPIITAARVWDDEEESNVIDAFVEMLRQRGYQRPRLKLLPKLKLGAEVQRTHGYREDELVTAAMMKDADPSTFLCSHSRIVTDRGIHVCPLLIDEPDSLMGQTKEEAAKPLELKHRACWHPAIKSSRPSPLNLRSENGSGLDVRIKHADLRPRGFVSLNESQVPWVRLIDVVGLTTFEHHVQRDVKVSVVDGTIKIRIARTGREKNGTRMT